MSMRNKKAGRSWQKQAAGYPFRDTAVQKANDQYWKNCTTIRTVNFTHRARRGRDHMRTNFRKIDKVAVWEFYVFQ